MISSVTRVRGMHAAPAPRGSRAASRQGRERRPTGVSRFSWRSLSRASRSPSSSARRRFSSWPARGPLVSRQLPEPAQQRGELAALAAQVVDADLLDLLFRGAPFKAPGGLLSELLQGFDHGSGEGCQALRESPAHGVGGMPPDRRRGHAWRTGQPGRTRPRHAPRGRPGSSGPTPPRPFSTRGSAGCRTVRLTRAPRTLMRMFHKPRKVLLRTRRSR